MNKQITVQEIWDVYRNAVNGKAYNGVSLPEDFNDMADSAQRGWSQVIIYINKIIQNNMEAQ